MSYLHRIVDNELDELIDVLPAIVLEGAKGVGKTETALQRAKTVFQLDDPAVQEIARADPRAILARPTPILLDEWQRVPSLWDAVRRAVDEGAVVRGGGSAGADRGAGGWDDRLHRDGSRAARAGAEGQRV